MLQREGRLLGRIASSFFCAYLLVQAGPAFAESYSVPVRIEAGPLPESLHSLERQTGMELLFDNRLVSEHQSPAVDGVLSTEAALRQLLAETDLTLRRAASGAWIIERPAAAPLAQPDAPVAEILVVGRRTQNADIRRFENDVQPYFVMTQAEIAGAHRDNIDQLFASRVTANTIAVPPGSQQLGSTLSEIDLRGLGSEDTLVLIDGRRMPSVPESYYGFRQSDLNAIPLHAIERIEVLTGTAGGIHGFGALGGVVNVVLDRKAAGLDLHLTGGMSSHGDSGRQAVEAKFGHSFGDGATDVVVFASHAETDTVRAGQRHYLVRDRRKTFELVPGSYETFYPNANSVGVQSIPHTDPVTGETDQHPQLVLKPEFGGATLPSDRTYLPAGFSGDAAALAAAFAQHAGQMDYRLTDVEAEADLGSNPKTDALLANLRHRFGERFEVFADAIVLRGRGEAGGDRRHAATHSGSALITSESPANPFTNDITIKFPLEGLDEAATTRIESTRYTVGLLAELPGDWRGSAELSWGESSNEVTSSAEIPALPSFSLFGDPSEVALRPFGDWETFQRALGTLSSFTFFLNQDSKFHDQSLRLAGPIFMTEAGPATLTVLAERRKEDIPTLSEGTVTQADGETTTLAKSFASRSVTTTSLYTELRTRLFDDSAPIALLRGLELQLAVRRDEEQDDFARDPEVEDPEFMHVDFEGTTYTAGAKLTPTPSLMLRGSYATGEQPPLLYNLNELEQQFWDFPLTTDPQRGDTYLGADGPYLIKSGGNANLKTVRATTLSVGTVLTPFGADGARLAVDFSRVRRTRDEFLPALDQVLPHEDFWPERVERAPLTDADRANGYTAGRVTMFDWRVANGGEVQVDALDIHAQWPLTLLGGRLELYADATRELRNVQKAPFAPDINRVGYREGPLKWKANGGFDWSKGSLMLGANAQYFDSTLVYKPAGDIWAPDTLVEYQGSRRIPSQWYLDLHGSWQVPVRGASPLDDLSIEVGIVNVLDQEPPRESFLLDSGPSYSRYGDPRQRRFELVLSCRF